MTPNEKSAIIGYWRSGTKIEQICVITGKPYDLIFSVIHNYKISIKD